LAINGPDNQILYQMAEAELRKLPQFKNSIAIPIFFLQQKINEFNKLKPEELQQKINEYFSTQEENKEGWGIFGLEVSNNNEPQKTHRPTEQKRTLNEVEMREFATEILLKNIKVADAKLEEYRNDFGYISFDAVYHGLSNIGDWTWDAITGRDDFKGYHEKSRDISKEKKALQELNSYTLTKIEFEKKFEKLYGIKFNPAAFEKLQQAEINLNTLNSNEYLSQFFEYSINKIEEMDINTASDFKIGALLYPILQGSYAEKQAYINELRSSCNNNEEFKSKMIQLLSNAKEQVDNNVNEILSKTTRDELESNYKNAYKSAMGDYHSIEDIDKFIQISQRNTMYTEMTLIIASSVLTMGSSAVQGLGAKAVTKFGAKAGGHIFKAGMTAATASLSSAETVLSGLTSKNGLTDAKLAEAREQFKSGLIFGTFGSYVSGPIGDKLVTLLKSNPKITSTIMQKAFSAVGFGTEITADALFELGLRGGDVETLFAENARGEALGRFMNMILGGRAHHASKALLDNISLKQDIDTDGKPKYSVIQDGKVVFETKDQNQIIAGIASAAAEAQGIKLEDLNTAEQQTKPTEKAPKTTETKPLTRESVQQMKQGGRNVTTMPDGTVVEYINGRAIELGKVEETKKSNHISQNDQINHITQPDKGIPRLIDDYRALKNPDGTQRLSEPEIEKIMQLRTKKPENAKLVDKFLALTDETGKPRFNTDNVETLIQLCNQKPENVELVNKFLALTDETGKPRFSSNDTQKLINLCTSEQNTKLVNEYVDITIKDINNNEVPRFDIEDIEDLMEIHNNSRGYEEFYLDLLDKNPNIAKLEIKLINKLLKNENFTNIYDLRHNLSCSRDLEIAKRQMDLINKLIDNPNFDPNTSIILLHRLNDWNIEIEKLKMDLADKLIDNPNFDPNNLANILCRIQNDPEIAKLQMDLANKLINNPNFDPNNLSQVFNNIQKDPEITKLQMDLADKLIDNPNFDPNNLANILYTIKNDTNLAKLQMDWADKLIDNPNFDPNNLANILYAISNDTNLAKLQMDCADKLIDNPNFDQNNLANILYIIKNDTNLAELQMDWADKLIDNPTFDNKMLSIILDCVDQPTMPFINTIITIDGLDLSKLPVMLEVFDLKDNGAGHGIDTNKIKRYTSLFQNPNTSQFMANKINGGMDIDTAAFLCKTQQKLNSEKQNSQVAEQNSKTANYSDEQNNTFETLTALGLNEKEANAIIKSISKDGVVDLNLQTQAVKLINQGIAKNKVGDIITSAKIEGEFNQKIVDDFVAIQNIGLNPLLEKNLAILNNIKGVTVAEKFNSKVKNQLKAMIEKLTPEMRANLESKGYDLDSITTKLNAQKVRNAENVPIKQKIEGLRNKSGIKGFEKIVVDKYNPEQMIWANEAACKKWADNKYSEMKSHDYHSVIYPNANKDRDQILKQWFDFMDNDNNIKDNPFVKILITEYLTKDLTPENAWLPPAFDKAIAKDILNSAVENSQSFSFGKIYAQRLREQAMKDSGGEKIEIDGIKGKWYTIPQTDSSSPDFKKNADRVKAFSDGTNWCIRTYNAEPYIQEGNIHFFVDDNGLTQVCVRENSPGSVYEIQKRQQNATVPIPYINVITDFMNKKGLTPQSHCQQNIESAVQAKPKYDALRTELQTLAKNNDHKAIMEKMGITVIVRPDNTYEISHYTPMIDQFTLSDLGIKENDLLQNVSVIVGDANFKDSNVTALPNLEEVGGHFNFQDSNISDIRKLKTINGYQIVWE